MTLRKTLQQKQRSKELLVAKRACSHHSLKLELAASSNEIRHLFATADILRVIKNKVIHVMSNRLKQIQRDKKYKSLIKAYDKYKENDIIKCDIASKIEKLFEKYKITSDETRNLAQYFGRFYVKTSQPKKRCLGTFYTMCADDIWSGIEKIKYSAGHRLHFSRRGQLPCVRSNSMTSCIIPKVVNNKLMIKFSDFKNLLDLKIKTSWEQEEVNQIINFLNYKEELDEKLLNIYKNTGKTIDTFRPCFLMIKCEIIRNKLRAFVIFCIEGKPVSRTEKRMQHIGRVGIDIGTQTIAITSDSQLMITNLAERSKRTLDIYKQMAEINRKLDRSRRMSNPNNYEQNGMTKKGKLNWIFSKRYLKLRRKLKELYRLSVINKKIANNEIANRIISLGSIFISEKTNVINWMKKTPKDKNNPNKRRKQFGRTIYKRNPGYLLMILERKAIAKNFDFIRVPLEFRASQYDPFNDTYTPHKLNVRKYLLSNESIVQRDLFSSFLLYNANDMFTNIDRNRCIINFKDWFSKHNKLIFHIKKNKIKVCNLGF